jgi:hypothetical protein
MLRSVLGHLHPRSLRMSTVAAPPRHKFFVYAPDKTDPDTFEKRLSVRSKHLETAHERNIAGIVSECHTWTQPRLELDSDAAPTMQSLVVPC